jgi:predicted DNA-binding transcriptional regulator AlpA
VITDFNARRKRRMESGVKSSKLLKVSELADWLGLKQSWVYAHADDLGAFRLGKYLRFSLPRVLKILEVGVDVATNVNLPTRRPPLTPIEKDTCDGQGTDSEQI